MVDDSSVKYREPMACGLLAAAALGVLSALALLFKSGDDIGSGIGFAEKSAAFGTLFASTLVVLALVGAVVLVTRLGAPTTNARVVVLVAMGTGAVDLLFAVITFLAQLGATAEGASFGGVSGAGKVVGVLLGLAHLLFLGVGLLYVYSAFQALPAPASTVAWGSGQPAGSPFGAYGGAGAPPPPTGGWSQQGWAQPGPPVAGWGQPPASGWAEPAQAGWGAPAGPSHPTPDSPLPGGAPGARPPSTGATVYDPAAPPAATPSSALPSAGPVEPAAGDDAPEAPPDPPSPAHGWWQHPGQ